MSTRTKRLFDVIGSIGGLSLFAPVMAAIAVAILLTDGRPLLFRQTRLGRGRRRFTIFKFRTMRDEKVTAIGRLLRATGLDELPQLVNLLRGELSAVGPRPLMEADVQTPPYFTSAGYGPFHFRHQLASRRPSASHHWSSAALSRRITASRVMPAGIGTRASSAAITAARSAGGTRAIRCHSVIASRA